MTSKEPVDDVSSTSATMVDEQPHNTAFIAIDDYDDDEIVTSTSSFYITEAVSAGGEASTDAATATILVGGETTAVHEREHWNRSITNLDSLLATDPLHDETERVRGGAEQHSASSLSAMKLTHDYDHITLLSSSSCSIDEDERRQRALLAAPICNGSGASLGDEPAFNKETARADEVTTYLVWDCAKNDFVQRSTVSTDDQAKSDQKGTFK